MAGGIKGRPWLVAAVIVLGSCDRGAAPRIRLADVERCEEGLEFAGLEPTYEQGMRTYLTACASVYVERECREALIKVGREGSDLASTAAEPCRRAYCPLLAAQHLKLCDAKEPLTQADAEQGWPPLHGAIVNHDAGRWASRLSLEMFRFYVAMQTRPHATNGPAR